MSHPLDQFTYILVDRKPVQHANDDEWGRWFFNMNNRRVAQTQVGDKWVSTIFGGIDRSYGHAPEPLVFETVIFDSDHKAGETWTSATWEQAERDHAEAVALINHNQEESK